MFARQAEPGSLIRRQSLAFQFFGDKVAEMFDDFLPMQGRQVAFPQYAHEVRGYTLRSASGECQGLRHVIVVVSHHSLQQHSAAV